MKRILIIQSLQPLFSEGRGFLDRTDINLIFVASNDDILRRHIELTADLIITTFDGSDLSVESLFSIIKQGKEFQKALLVLACENTPGLSERAKRCGANVVLTLPIDHGLLNRRIRELLDVAPRKAYRVTFNIAVDGKFRNRPFLCRSENVSASGMLVRAREDMQPGDRVSCSFYLPDGTQIRAAGEVARAAGKDAASGENLYGVKFIDISDRHKALLETFVEREYHYRLSQTCRKSAYAA